MYLSFIIFFNLIFNFYKKKLRLFQCCNFFFFVHYLFRIFREHNHFGKIINKWNIPGILIIWEVITFDIRLYLTALDTWRVLSGLHNGPKLKFIFLIYTRNLKIIITIIPSNITRIVLLPHLSILAQYFLICSHRHYNNHYHNINIF